jgi:hypothetical protein
MWREGHQPLDVRTADETLLPEKTEWPIDRELATVVHAISKTDRPMPASLGFHTMNSAVQWRALGIEVIRGIDGKAVGAKPAPKDGEVLFSDGFEEGIDNWTHAVDGQKGVFPDQVEAVETDTPKGRSKVMFLDGGKVPGKKLAAYLMPRIAAEAVTMECDIFLEKTYRRNDWTWSLSCWVPLRGSQVDEIYRNQNVSNRLRKEGAWIRYRRDMITREENGRYAVYLTSYLNGELNSQVRMTSKNDPRRKYRIWFSARDVRVGLDNLTIKAMTPDPNWKPMKKK